MRYSDEAVIERRDLPVDGLRAPYHKSLRMVERLHRLLLDVIKDEFERIGRSDINPVQALLVFNIGEAELTAGELRTRGYYLGSNVSYNLKKLVDMGYIDHKRSDADKRSVRIRLTDKGLEARAVVEALYERQLGSLGPVAGLTATDLDQINTSLLRLERYWADQIRFRL